MTRKHFEAIAHALNGERPFRSDFTDPDAHAVRVAQWTRIVKTMADVCAGYNGAFDRGRFERACGL